MFDSAEAFQTAADELLSSGFDRADLSLLASEHAVEEKLGHIYKRVEELEDDPKVPRTAYVSDDAIGDARGALISSLTFVGAIGAAGAMAAAGGALAGMVEQHHADHLNAQLEKGGLLLWVRTRDPEHEERAQGILRKHGALDVHIHEIASHAA